MEVLVGRDVVAFVKITDAVVGQIVKSNDLGEPSKWPILKTTGRQHYMLPEDLRRRAKRHPEWKMDRLDDYRVTDGVFDGRHVTFLYKQDVHVFIIFFEPDVPEG